MSEPRSALENDIRELRGANPGELAARLVGRGWQKSDDSLDAAWQEAEAALPEGWALHLSSGYSGGFRAAAWASNPIMSSVYEAWGEGDTPAAALRALASALRSTGDKE